MEKINTLIVDDEPLARQIIREYLESHNDVTVVAECGNAHDALKILENTSIDLLFLDIQMPEVSGFELLEMLETLPHVVFCTAYDQYAIQAFDVNAIDYLLKPLVQERFDGAVEKARRTIRTSKVDTDSIGKLLDHIQSERKYLSRLLIKQSGRIVIVNTEDILWIESIEDYVNIHTAEEPFLVLQSLAHIEEKINPDVFIRVHRSYIVNISKVTDLLSWSNGRLKCILSNGQELILSRSGARKLKELLI